MAMAAIKVNRSVNLLIADYSLIFSSRSFSLLKSRCLQHAQLTLRVPFYQQIPSARFWIASEFLLMVAHPFHRSDVLYWRPILYSFQFPSPSRVSRLTRRDLCSFPSNPLQRLRLLLACLPLFCSNSSNTIRSLRLRSWLNPNIPFGHSFLFWISIWNKSLSFCVTSFHDMEQGSRTMSVFRRHQLPGERPIHFLCPW